MNNKYSVSVVVTTKNRKLFLIRAISSIINQSLPPIEIIIIDDNSEINEKISITELTPLKNINNISIVIEYNTKSMGGNYSRNKGVELSVGNIIMFLDDDDYWLPDKIKDQINVFKSNSNIGLVYTGKNFVYSNNLDSIIRKSKENINNKNNIWKGNFPGSTSGVAVTRKCFEIANKFDENLNSLQDYDLWIRIIKITKVTWDKKYNLIYTIHNSHNLQISSDVNKHINSINYLKMKYSDEISNLDLKTKRIFLSRMEHIVARAYRRNNDFRFLKYYIKSLFLYPSIRTLILPIYYK
ncbi:glycosyltransferase family 2 protein [Proteus mirabilis]|uniref:glycosyltransferase family 2 protein n=1 Tax=Morganellaceae TaxID=1903414 RepID=UPI002025168B|nr:MULTISPECIES: glycosyltransferase family 2 protein [Morganellaceae]MCL8608219.1 glycosyltransferase family 2 protein [Proteus mirabilis]MDK7738486.1 glycosyltransferase family 2 protein [Providencia stuartii]